MLRSLKITRFVWAPLIRLEQTFVFVLATLLQY